MNFQDERFQKSTYKTSTRIRNLFSLPTTVSVSRDNLALFENLIDTCIFQQITGGIYFDCGVLMPNKMYHDGPYHNCIGICVFINSIMKDE